MVPAGEVAKAQRAVHAGKHAVRAVLKELTEANPGSTKWPALMPKRERVRWQAVHQANGVGGGGGGGGGGDDDCDDGDIDDDDDDDDDDNDDDVDVEDVGCSVCSSLESTEENDILLCDRKGCYRAYHMR